MTLDFDSQYLRLHQQIQADRGLVSAIYRIARTSVYSETCRYVHAGMSGEMPIGLDLSEDHVTSFGMTVAKMRLLYELSNGKADLLRVYARLEGKLWIVSEDVFHGAGFF